MGKIPVWADHFLRGYIEDYLGQATFEPAWETSVNLGQRASVEEALQASVSRIVQIQGESGSGKSRFLRDVFRQALEQEVLPCIPVLFEPEQPGRFFERFCLQLQALPRYPSLTAAALENSVQASGVPLLIFAEQGALPVHEIKLLRAQGHSLIITGPNPDIQVDEIWQMDKIPVSTALPYLQKLVQWNDDWENAFQNFQQTPLIAFELSNLQSSLSEMVPNCPAEWQAAKEGKLEAYQAYLKALKGYLQKYTPDFHANAFDEGFVPVNVSTQVEVQREPVTEENPEATDEKEMTWQTKVPDELIKTLRVKGSGRLVITGGAGSGKSTLLRHLCLKMAQNHAHVWPLYLRLYDIQASGIGKQDLQHILELHEELAQLQRVYRAYRGEESQVLTFLFLDGWDEVSQARDDMALWLKNRLNRYPVVLASREQSLETQNRSEELYWTLDFDANSQGGLISNFPGLNPEEKKAILEKIAHTSGLFGNPLFICLFAQTYKGAKSLDLNTKTKLMEYFCKALISDWNQKKLFATSSVFEELLDLTKRKKFDSHVNNIQDELFELLAYLAFSIHCSGVELTPEHLDQWLETFPTSSANILVEKLKQDKQYLKDWLKKISRVSGLIQEIPIHPNSYRFLHQSFQEYLCAYFIHHHMSPEKRDWFITDKTVKQGPRGWEYLPPQPEDWPWSYLDDAQGKYPLMQLHDPLWREVIVYLMALDSASSEKGISQILCWRIFQGELSHQKMDLNWYLAARGAMQKREKGFLNEKIEDKLIEALGDRNSNLLEKAAAAKALGQIGTDKSIYYLIEAIHDVEPIIRRAVAESLEQTRSEMAIVNLIMILENRNLKWYARKTATEILGKIRTDRAVNALVNALSYIDIRQFAADALKKNHSEKAVDALIQAFEDSDSDVKKIVAGILGQLRSEKAVDALLQSLEDRDSDVRKIVAEALGQIGSEKAVDALIQALNDSNWRVRQAVVRSLILIKTDDPIIKPLRENNGSINSLVIHDWQHLKNDPRIIHPLAGFLRGSDSDQKIRESVINLLKSISTKQAVNVLIEAALYNMHSDVRQTAAQALRQIDSDKAVDALIQALKENNNLDVKQAAAIALGHIGSDKALEALIQALKNTQEGHLRLNNDFVDKTWHVREAAANALGKIKSEKSLEELIQAAIWDWSSSVRQAAAQALRQIDSEKAVDELIKFLAQRGRAGLAAAEALGEIGSEKAIDPLIVILDDEDSDVRHAAVWALGEIRSDIATDALIDVLYYKDEERCYVRQAVAKALGQIGSDNATDTLIRILHRDDDENSDVRVAAAKALAEIGSDKAIGALIITLNDSDWNVRMSGTEVLKKIRTENAADVLIRAFNDAEDYFVREATAEVLGQIGSEKAVEPLIAALGDEKTGVRAAVANALGLICSEQATEALIQTLLKDKEWSIQVAAAKALGKIGSDKAAEALIKALKNWYLNFQEAKEDCSDNFCPESIQDLTEMYTDAKEAVKEALIKVSSEAVVNVLIQSLGDELSDIREIAAQTLTQVKTDDPIVQTLKVGNGIIDSSVIHAWQNLKNDSRIIHPLMGCLCDSDSSIRKSSIDTLVSIGSETVVDVLIQSAQRDSSYYENALLSRKQDSAIVALGQIGSEKAVDALIHFVEYRKSIRAAEVLGTIGAKKAIDVLAQALNDGHYPNIRKTAAKALGEIGDKKAVDALANTIDDNDSDVRKAAIKSLGQIESDKAMQALIKALGQKNVEDVRLAAAEALGQIGSEKAMDALIQTLLKDKEWSIRVAAAEALGKIGSKRSVEALTNALNDEDSDVRDSAKESLKKINLKNL